MKRSFLLFLQIILFAGIIWFSGSLYVTSVPFVVMQMVGVLVIFWALLVGHLHKKHSSPVAHKQGVYFLTEGPYEFMRHPVYTGLLLIALSYVQQFLTLGSALAFLGFAIILLLLVGHDERVNEFYFKHRYSDHKKATKRLIPYLY